MTKEIKHLLPLILGQQANWKFDLLNNWQTIFGPLSSRVHLEKAQEDTLILGVQDSCLLQELYLLSSVLLKTINQTLDQPRIKHLRFKIIGIKKKKQQPTLQRKEQSLKTITLTTTEQEALTHIKDPSMRKALESFLVRCYREKE